MYDIVYLPIAKNVINKIILYISEELKSPSAALDLLNEFEKSITVLRDFPYSYKLYESNIKIKNKYRVIPIKNYLIFYMVRQDVPIIEIYRVLYARRNINKFL